MFLLLDAIQKTQKKPCLRPLIFLPLYEPVFVLIVVQGIQASKNLMPKIDKNSNELQGKRRRRLRGPRFRNLLPIQELRLGRRTKRPSKEKVPRKRRERKRFTNKQKPILHLFLLNAH